MSMRGGELERFEVLPTQVTRKWKAVQDRALSMRGGQYRGEERHAGLGAANEGSRMSLTDPQWKAPNRLCNLSCAPSPPLPVLPQHPQIVPCL